MTHGRPLRKGLPSGWRVKRRPDYTHRTSKQLTAPDPAGATGSTGYRSKGTRRRGGALVSYD